MKYKKNLAALVLSIAVLTGTTLPVFAEPETDVSTTPSTSETTTTPDASTQTTENTTENTPEEKKENPENAETTENGENKETPEQKPAEPEEKPEPLNQTSSVAEDGSIQMPTIDIDATASILVNGETGEIIHADNEHKKTYPASCTKIMTALLALEHLQVDDIVTMEDSDFKDVKNGASNAGLKVGEKITVENLLYCLMLPSGNEAANALARATGGSISDFVNMMNDRAKELGCTNTHFVNPNGLHDENHYSSAYDMYLIAAKAMENSTFATVVNTAQKKLPATNLNEERLLYNTNHLILSRYSSVYYDNCYGIKTGHTTPAGYCLVSYAKQNGYTYYSVVFGAKAGEEYAGSFTETKRMFEWAFDNFRMKTATAAGAAVTECPVRLGRGSDHVTLVTAKDVPVLIPKGLDLAQLDTKITTEKSYDAPIAKGQKLGTVTYSYKGMKCATADLISLTEIKRSPILYVFDQIAKFFHLTAVCVILGIVITAFVLYLVLSFISGRNRRRNQMLRAKRKRKNKNQQRRK